MGVLKKPENMKMSERIKNKQIVIILLVVLVLVLFIFSFAIHYFLDGMKVRLLCKTNHHALLEACNGLSKQAASGNLKPGKYEVFINPDPEVSKFPREIMELGPRYVYIDENGSGRVMIEMTGALELHFGVLAYTEDFKKPFKSFEYGDRELIPRLWYYDDGYNNNPEYDKQIKTLIQKGIKTR